MTRLDLIREIVDQNKAPTAGAEVGVLRGDFAAKILGTKIAKLHLVDAWTHIEGEYEKDPANVDEGGMDERERFVRQRFDNDRRVEIHKMLSVNAARLFRENELDFAFIDADHTFRSVMNDLIAWNRPARVLLVHDYTESTEAKSMGFGVVPAVDWFCRNYGWRIAAKTDEEWPTVKLVPNNTEVKR